MTPGRSCHSIITGSSSAMQKEEASGSNSANGTDGRPVEGLPSHVQVDYNSHQPTKSPLGARTGSDMSRASTDSRGPASRNSMASNKPSSRGSVTSSKRKGGSSLRKDGNRGMVLPFEPLSMSFQNIYYSVDLPAVSLVPPDPSTHSH